MRPERTEAINETLRFQCCVVLSKLHNLVKDRKKETKQEVIPVLFPLFGVS